jgi:NADPH-dependent 2,4-dienoyl-CoA reductase/sulfur reductase-like enzyme
MLNRRQVLTNGAVLGLSAALARPALAQTKPKVVIIGGGPGGGSVLRALSATAGGKLNITLIEAQTTYTTCFYSNLFLGGFQALNNLQYGFDAVKKLAGVKVVTDVAESINREGRTVSLRSGGSVPYDLLVLSPGIDIDYASVPGWSKDGEERMPHAWKAGPQLELLKRQLDAVSDGGLIVVIAPPAPYRCPPGPYERVSMMAHALKSAGKTKARIVVLDPKASFSKQPLFQQGWERHYPGMVEWLPPSIHGGIKTVNPATMTVETAFETYSNAALVNVIPRQTAGQIAVKSGLTDEKGYCPIDAFSTKSRSDAHIFVVGDACIPGDMPKSAFAANSQAQVAAQAIRAELLGETRPEAGYLNTCWSLIDTDDSVKIGGTYKPTPQKIEEVTRFISKLEDTPDVRRTTYEESAAWYAGLTRELFT